MSSLLFSGGTVVDGTLSEPTRADVLVRDGRVVQVGDVGEVPEDAEVIDCTGRFVTPGLFDCHVHFMMEQPTPVSMLQTPFSLPYYLAIERMRRTLAVGITWVRDAAGTDLGTARAVRDGLVPGPRMQIALSMLSQTGGHGDDWQACGAHVGLPSHPSLPDGVVDGPIEMRKRVRELVRAGADVIKVATSGGVMSPRSNPLHGHLREDEIAALVTEANAAGLHVMAHAQATVGIKAAVRGGIRSIEHGIYLDDEAIDLMLEHGTWLVPTLLAPRAVLAMGASGAPLPDAVLAKARMVAEAHDDSVRRAIAAGVKVAMGTDSGVGVHGTNLDELGLMASLGMTPTQVWHASTRSAAELLGVEADHGTLEPGKVADVVVFDGDPTDFTDLADRVQGVWMAGEHQPV